MLTNRMNSPKSIAAMPSRMRAIFGWTAARTMSTMPIAASIAPTMKFLLMSSSSPSTVSTVPIAYSVTSMELACVAQNSTPTTQNAMAAST